MKSNFFKITVAVGFVFAVTLLFHTSCLAAEEKDYPSKPVTLIGSMQDGGASDVLLRPLASVMYNYMGQPFIVINKAGAQGSLAGSFVAKSKPDGYTAANLISTGAVPEIYKHFFEANYTRADLKPVMRLASFPYALSVRSDSPWKTFEDVVNYSKKNPGKVSYGHAGRGHIYHLLMTAVCRRAGIQIKDVTFKGGGPTNTALLGGHIDLGISATAGQQPFVEAGKFRMLVLEHWKRLDNFKDVPTFKEIGYDFGLGPWANSLFVPKDTPDAIVKKLHDGIQKAMGDTSFKAMAANAGLNIDYADAETVKMNAEADRKVIGGFLKELGFWKD